MKQELSVKNVSDHSGRVKIKLKSPKFRRKKLSENFDFQAGLIFGRRRKILFLSYTIRIQKKCCYMFSEFINIFYIHF